MPTQHMSLKKLINNNDLDGIKAQVAKEPRLCNEIIKWGLLNKNQVHPLHYLCDRVFSKDMDDKLAGEIAQLLIDNGAKVDGYGFEELKDTPLVAATSLSADAVALALINAGADIHHAGCFGGTALHWAAWCGRDEVVSRLLQEEIDLDRRCVTHQSTAFFWAAHGLLNAGEHSKHNQRECARIIKDAGADTSIPNINNITAKEMLKDDPEFLEMLDA